jgi:peptidoglycan/xylan/chitin deacetylase (PgdA/CDA1 family)
MSKSKLRRIVKRTLAKFLRKTGAVKRQCNQGGVIILMLHKVDENSDALPLTISAKIFEQILTELTAQHEIVSLDSLFDANNKFSANEKLRFVITFDDGYRNNYDYAYPILSKHKVPAIIYLSLGHLDGDFFFWYEQLAIGLKKSPLENIDLTDLGSGKCSLKNQQDREAALIQLNQWLKLFSDQERMDKLEIILSRLQVDDAKKEVSPMLSWEMVEEMMVNNIDFGSHTISHPILSHESRDSIEYEVVTSKEKLERKLGKSITGFAYPNGTLDDYNDTVLEFVEKAGYLHACTTVEGTNYQDADPYQLKRINIHTGMCTDDNGDFHADLFWAKITSQF